MKDRQLESGAQKGQRDSRAVLVAAEIKALLQHGFAEHSRLQKLQSFWFI